MADEPKTKPTDQDPRDFLAGIEDPRKQQDALALLDLMRDVTGQNAVMWGSSIVGFGTYRLKYASGREGDWPVVAFSPRKQNLTLYLLSGFDGYQALLDRLGRHTTGKGCLYIKKLADVNLDTLRELVRQSVAQMDKTGPA